MSKKILGLVAGVALFVGVALPAANALTLADIEMLISIGMIPAEQANAARAAFGATPAPAAGCYLYTRDLTVGSTGADVVALQDMLIGGGFLSIPAGTAKGYFGSLTQQAVARYQVARGIAPTAGYFGPKTRATIICAPAVPAVPVTPVTPVVPRTTLGSGEASLESFELNDEEDEIAEGESEIVATIEFEVENGDIKIDRVDLTFATNTNEEDEPWDVLSEIRLIAGGKEIASEDVSDEDDWLDEDGPYTFRFTGLNYVVKEGDVAMIDVEITANDNVDGSDDSDAEWTMYVDTDAVRGTDGEGLTQEIGDADETVTFDIVGEGEGDDLELASSDDEIEEDTIVIDEDDTTDAPIFAFVLTAEDSDNDIEINEIEIDIEISSTSGAIEDLVNDFWVEIDGDSFKAESYDDDGDTTTLTFDIDGDITVDSDDEVEVVLYAEFAEMESDSDYQGVTITASLDTDQIEAEGKDEVEVGGSNQDGEEQTLRTTGIIAEFESDSFTEEKPADELDGTIKIVFSVTAIGDDFEFADDGSDFTYDLTGADEVDAAVTVSGETADSGDFDLKENETDVVTLSVKFATTTGFVQLEVSEVLGYTVQDIITDQY